MTPATKARTAARAHKHPAIVCCSCGRIRRGCHLVQSATYMQCRAHAAICRAPGQCPRRTQAFFENGQTCQTRGVERGFVGCRLCAVEGFCRWERTVAKPHPLHTKQDMFSSIWTAMVHLYPEKPDRNGHFFLHVYKVETPPLVPPRERNHARHARNHARRCGPSPRPTFTCGHALAPCQAHGVASCVHRLAMALCASCYALAVSATRAA